MMILSLFVVGFTRVVYCNNNFTNAITNSFSFGVSVIAIPPLAGEAIYKYLTCSYRSSVDGSCSKVVLFILHMM